MSVLTDVLGAVRSGISADRLGPVLGVDAGLAALALEHWVNLGVVTPSTELSLGCTTCGSDDAPTGPTCVGCPFSRSGRASTPTAP